MAETSVPAARRAVRVWPAAAGPIGRVAFATIDGRAVLAAGGTDGRIWLWDPRSGTAGAEALAIAGGQVGALAAADLGGRPLLAAGSQGGAVTVWDLRRGSQLQQFGLSGNVLAVALAVAGDRSVLAATGRDGRIHLWDVDTGAALHGPLGGHTAEVRGLAFGSLGGSVALLSAGLDGTLRVWDIAEGREAMDPLVPADGATPGLWSLAVASSGGTDVAATGDAGGTVRLWDIGGRADLGSAPRRHVGLVSTLALVDVNGVVAIRRDVCSVAPWTLADRWGGIACAPIHCFVDVAAQGGFNDEEPRDQRARRSELPAGLSCSVGLDLAPSHQEVLGEKPPPADSDVADPPACRDFV